MTFWRYVIGLAALIFCGTSLVFSVGLWISIPAGEAGKLVAGLTACALELCKFAFAPFGLWLRAQGRALGYVLLLLWPLLVVISIAATVGFLAGHTAQQQQLNVQGSVEYQTFTQKLTSIEQQITSLNSVIKTDAKNGYRQRALKTVERLAALEQQRNQVLAQLNTLRVPATDSAQAAFANLAALIHINPAALQQGGLLALAIVTDVVGLVALLAFNGSGTFSARIERSAPASKRLAPSVERSTTPPKRSGQSVERLASTSKRLAEDAEGLAPTSKRLAEDVERSDSISKRSGQSVKRSTPISKRLAPTVEPQQTVVNNAKRTSELNPQQTELATRIRRGEFGRRPVLRQINRAVRGGNLVVKPVFDFLMASGDLIRKGRGFALVAHQGEGRS
ncbi:hypothetical protein [Microbulbifer spongiae]|uniref:Uncharacterized protein n=1 Tax=Microbulbifer spongiae TaxID=2944933 RepID=A0ABY9E5R9_9GAMM|nr:hypothetical protein [Microbulbifer sp. MI-G]WKD48360.1 hypothetical protein M8T91_10475 [Microbulbifer sp. MI-G]